MVSAVRPAAGLALRLTPVVAIAVLAGCELWPADANPFTTIHPSTDFGQATQDLYGLFTWWMSAIAVIVGLIFTYTVIRFRDDGSPGNPVQVHGNAQMELGWTLLPVFIVIAITVPTIRTIFEIGASAPEGALEVRVIGKRWWWEFQYVESGVITANELHLPVGKPISLLIESDTVIHSFWVPRLGGKRDAVPGRINRIWFTIQDAVAKGEAPLEYLGECAEFCGEQHARMRKRVYGHNEADFEQWLTDMKTPVTIDPKVQADGEAAFTAVGCGGCHSITGNKSANARLAPNLTRFGQRHSVGAGAGVFDPNGQMMSETDKLTLLKTWIHNPDSIKTGTTAKHNASRSIDGMNVPRADDNGDGLPDISDAELDALATYLLAMK